MTTKTFALTLVLIAACHDVNPNYQAPDGPGSGSNVGIDAGSGSGSGSAPACTTNAMCSGTTPICDTSMGTCVKCGSDADCTAPTGTCLPTGACDGDTDIAYVTMMGSDTGTCPQATPCKTVDYAVKMTTKPYVEVTANPMDGTATIARDVLVFGRMNAKLTRATGSGPVIAVTGAANVEFDDIEITMGANAGSGDGIASTTTGTVTLQDVLLDKNQALGLFASSGRVVARRSAFNNNNEGGILLNATSFLIENCMVMGNGAPGAGGSPTGGIAIQAPVSTSDTVQFTTVAGNSASDGSTGGIQCTTTTTTPLTLSNNIVSNNAPTALAQVVVGVQCSYTYSDIFPGTLVPGTGNGSADPKLMGDGHLMPNSPAIDAALPTATLKIDYFGIKRPQGLYCDMGASEYKP